MKGTNAQNDYKYVLYADEYDNEEVGDDDTDLTNHDHGYKGRTYVLPLVERKGNHVHFTRAAIDWNQPDNCKHTNKWTATPVSAGNEDPPTKGKRATAWHPCGTAEHPTCHSGMRQVLLAPKDLEGAASVTIEELLETQRMDAYCKLMTETVGTPGKTFKGN